MFASSGSVFADNDAGACCSAESLRWPNAGWDSWLVSRMWGRCGDLTSMQCDGILLSTSSIPTSLSQSGRLVHPHQWQWPAVSASLCEAHWAALFGHQTHLGTCSAQTLASGVIPSTVLALPPDQLVSPFEGVLYLASLGQEVYRACQGNRSDQELHRQSILLFCSCAETGQVQLCLWVGSYFLRHWWTRQFLKVNAGSILLCSLSCWNIEDLVDYQSFAMIILDWTLHCG